MALIEHHGSGGHRTALEEPATGQCVAYDTLAAAAAIVAGLIPQRKGLVFHFVRNDPGGVIGLIALLSAGHAVVLLDPAMNRGFQRDLATRYQPDLVVLPESVTSEALVGTDYRELACPLLGYRMLAARRPATTPIHPDLAVLLSTSGTTGSPKLVRLSHANLEHNADCIREALTIGDDERPITSLPLYYSYGLSVLTSHLRAGAKVVLCAESVVSAAFWDTFRAARCTSFAGVPYTYQILKRLGFANFDLPTLRTITQAGGKLDTAHIRLLHESMVRRGGQLVVMYGQTEATARIACLPSARLMEKLGSAGVVIPRGRLSIDANASGEVLYQGPNVMMGYAHQRADLACGDDLGGLLRTGDLGYLDEEGFLFLTGRNQRDTKVFGLRVNLDEVEALLRPNGPTAAVGVAGTLMILCEYGDDATFSLLQTELAQRLNLHHSALVFRRVEALPLTANGKIDYQRLAELV